MNDEVGNFLIKFTTEGFDKVEKSLNELNKGMDKLNDSFKKGTEKGESFFGALLKWDILVGTITKSFRALRDEISSVFDVASEMTTLFKKEEDLGVEAKVLERWGIIARRFKGSQNDAYSFFESVQNMMLKASTPALWSESDAKDMALAGIRWSYNQGASPTANRDAYLLALRDAVLRTGNDADKRSLLKKYIGQESLYTFFGSKQEDFDSIMKWADNLRVLSKDPEKLKDAQDLETVRLEWQQIWKKIEVQLIPILSSLLTALKPLEKPMLDLAERLGKWVDKNKGNFAKWVEDAAKWVADELPSLFSRLVQALVKVAEIVSNIYDWMSNKGVIGKTWDSIKFLAEGIEAGAKTAVNAIVGDDVLAPSREFAEKYAKEGTGGYLGSLVRGIDGVARLPASVLTEGRGVVNNNYLGDTVHLTGGAYPETTITPRHNAPTGAMMASLMK